MKATRDFLFVKFLAVGLLAACAYAAAVSFDRPLSAQEQLSRPIPDQADPTDCMSGSLVGSYGFSRNGTAAPGPVAAVGSIEFDGHGNLSGSDTTSANGTIIRRTFAGTYTVNPDCTGSFTATFISGTPGRVANTDFVIVDDRRGLLLIGTNPGEIIVGTARSQSALAIRSQR